MLTIDKQIEAISRLSRIKSVVTKEELLRLGINRFEQLTDSGKLIESTSKSFVLSEAEITINRSMAEAIALIPQGVICLASALEIHDLTSVIAGKVYLAVPQSQPKPDTENLAIKLIPMSQIDYSTGVETIKIEGIETKIYNVPKTIADCFALYWEVGHDIALQAIADALQNNLYTKQQIIDYCSNRKLEPHTLDRLKEGLRNPEKIYSYT